MSWKDIIKKDYDDIMEKYYGDFTKFVTTLTDSLIETELDDHLSRTTSDDPHYKNHEISLKEVMHSDLFHNIGRRLEKAIGEVVFKEDELGNILVISEAIDKNEEELNSKNLEW